MPDPQHRLTGNARPQLVQVAVMQGHGTLCDSSSATCGARVPAYYWRFI